MGNGTQPHARTALANLPIFADLDSASRPVALLLLSSPAALAPIRRNGAAFPTQLKLSGFWRTHDDARLYEDKVQCRDELRLLSISPGGAKVGACTAV